MSSKLINQSHNYKAFDGLSENYDKYRPDYPAICFEIIKKMVESNDSVPNMVHRVLDVGCGTGKCTKMLREQFKEDDHIYGIDTSTDMLSIAKSQHSDIDFRFGYAESFYSDYQNLDCIVTAQAIQWFDREKFYSQVYSSLSKNGVFCVLQNNRDWRNSDFLDEYESLMEKYNEGYNRFYRDINIIDEVKNTGAFLLKIF